MDPQNWNKRYAENESVYGTEPNVFFKNFINTHNPGSILLPAEGEGRNAIYAASKGWRVDAFDFSEPAVKKALKRAAEKNILLHYEIRNIEDFLPDKQYDAVALIYVHLPVTIRKEFHQRVYESLKPGGYLVFEAFAKEQIHYNSGGPKDLALLYDAPAICSDFSFLHMLFCAQKEVVLDEGIFHKGKAEVLQLVGQKL